MTALHEFKPLSPETVECPYPFYAALRREAPVYQVPGAGFFIVSRYDDVLEALRHPEIFSSRSGPGLARYDEEIEAIYAQGYPRPNTLLTNDPPDHKRYRLLVNKAFSARRVAQLEPAIRAVANELVDGFTRDGHAELVSQFAVKLPLTVIADALGVPRSDLDTFKRWSDAAIAPLGGMISREEELECARLTVEFQHYFAARLDERRQQPRDDILTDLLNARLDGAEPLSTAEILAIVHQVLVAGNETTTNLIAAGMLLLLQHPAHMAALRADLSRVPAFVEEVLRYESPVQGLFRIATQDTVLGGVPIPRGARLVLMYGAANRDESFWGETAEMFDPERPNAGDHLAFGRGEHFCLGAALARAEARIAFETLLTRLPNLRLAPEGNDFSHMQNFILRGLRKLCVEWDV
jgi:cytochrome P450